jgi:hypothetical protein
MLSFLSTYWLWILLIGGMLFMHLGHRGGCGAGQSAAHGDHGAAGHPGSVSHTDDTERSGPGIEGTDVPVGGGRDHSARTPASR